MQQGLFYLFISVSAPPLYIQTCILPFFSTTFSAAGAAGVGAEAACSAGISTAERSSPSSAKRPIKVLTGALLPS